MSRITRITVVLTVLVGSWGASHADAQSWDVPSFFPPRPGNDIGVYLTDEGDASLFGIWRDGRHTNLGLRGGVTFRDDPAGHVGFDVHGDVAIRNADVPLDIIWTIGGGATFDDDVRVWIPFGVSFGRVVALEGATIQPYAHPRIGPVIEAEDDETELDFGGVIDLGVDVVAGDRMTVRFGAALGTFDAIGIGLAWKTGRPLAVR